MIEIYTSENLVQEGEYFFLENVFFVIKYKR